jgi:hypothetical protein
MKEKIKELLQSPPVVINIGLAEFAENLQIQGVDVVQVPWNPPQPADEEMLALLDKLL